MASSVCVGCGSQISPRRYRGQTKKWCSKACRAAYARWQAGDFTKRYASGRACVQCGRDFIPKQDRSRFCSQDCHLTALRDRRLSEVRYCDGCGMEFRSATAGTRFCSLICARAHTHRGEPQARPCADCGAEVRNTGYVPLCSDCGKERQKEIWRRKNRKRRGDDIAREPYTLAEIARRDGYRCGLCHGKVDIAITYLRLDSPTIDHIVPLSVSRDDTRTNVQLAHRGCNNAKGNRGSGEQLMLIG